MSVIRILVTFSNLLFVAAIGLGICLPEGATVAYVLTLPALTVTLTLTLLRFPGGFFNKPRELLSGVLLGNLMNYLILGNLIILGSLFLIRDEKLWIGLVLVAAIPSAVAVLPLGEKLQTQKMLTLSGFAGTYIGGLILIPLIGLAFLKFLPISYDKLIILAISLIALPLLLSRLVVDRNWESWIEYREGTISDVCYFVVFYAMAASNARMIIQGRSEIVVIALLALILVFLISSVLLMLGRFYKIPRETITVLLLLGTMKNCGLAGGIALYVFGSEVAIPALIFSFFIFLTTIWLKFRARNYAESSTSEAKTQGTDS